MNESDGRDNTILTQVRIVKSHAKYCEFLFAADLLNVCWLFCAMLSSVPRALKRAIAASRSRSHLG